MPTPITKQKEIKLSLLVLGNENRKKGITAIKRKKDLKAPINKGLKEFVPIFPIG